GDVHLHSAEGGRDRRIGVTIYEDPVRRVLVKYRIELAEHRTGLHAVRTGPDTQMDFWCGDAQLGEDHDREHRDAVLTRVDDHVLDPGRFGRTIDRCEFDELRAGADDTEDLHEPQAYGSSVAVIARPSAP